MKKIFVCLLIFNSLNAEARDLKWYSGSVVLVSGKVVVGNICIDPLLDVLLVEQNNLRTVYPAYRIRSLYFYDGSSDINRRFISIKERSPFHNQHRLFEVVVQGDVSVLRKQQTRGSKPSDATDFTYFVMYNDELVLLRKFKKKIYPFLKSSMDKLEEYVSANNLYAGNNSNAIRIIEHYNRQLRADSMTAKH